MLQRSLPTACKLVCVVCSTDALSARGMGEEQLYVSGMQVFQLVFTLSTGKQIFFPLVEEEETVGGKERRGITHSHFPEWRREKQHISSTPVYTYNWLSFRLQV